MVNLSDKKILRGKELSEEDLEKKSREFLKANMKNGFLTTYFNPFVLKDVEEKIPLINYLDRKRYIMGMGTSVAEFHYDITPEGKHWVLS